jgi:integrase
MLSTLKVKTAKPEVRPYKLSDGGGLYLLVQPNGSKLWRYKFRVAGKEGLQAFGSFPEVGLAEARDRHAEARKLVSQGINPTQARRKERIEQAQFELERVEGLFSAVVAHWCGATATGLRPATVRQRQREISNDLLPALAGRHLSSITRLEVTALLKRVETRAPEVARNLRNHLWGIFEYAIDTGLLEINPVPPVRVMKKRSQKHHAALSEEQLGSFLRAVTDCTRMQEETSIAMQLVLLTACRKAEVIEALWKEIDMDNAQWEIPADRMKGGRPHWVPLSSQAVGLIKRLRELVPTERKHLFPNRNDPKRPMANRSLNAVMERLGFSSEGTPHGMRSAFSTHFNRLEQSIDVIEHCLAHAPSNTVRAAYNRHAYRPERRIMLQRWADHLDGLKQHATMRDVAQISSV